MNQDLYVLFCVCLLKDCVQRLASRLFLFFPRIICNRMRLFLLTGRRALGGHFVLKTREIDRKVYIGYAITSVWRRKERGNSAHVLGWSFL